MPLVFPKTTGGGTIAPMSPILAVVWHFWIAVILSGGAVLALIATIAAYAAAVSRTRYPKR